MLLHVGDAILEEREDRGRVVGAEPVARAQILVDPHLHGASTPQARRGARTGRTRSRRACGGDDLPESASHSPGSEPPIDTYRETDEALTERDLQVGARSIAGPWRWTGFVAALLIAASAPIWHLAGNEWRLTLPGVPFNGEKPVTTMLFLVSAGVLAISWMLMVRRIERSAAPDRARTRAIIVTAALWFVPVLLGPPLLSSDVYSYAAQGEMVTKGLDPTSQGMSRLQFGEYVLRVDPLGARPRSATATGRWGWACPPWPSSSRGTTRSTR